MFILRANTNIRNENPKIPEGYRWVTIQEYQNIGRGIATYNYFNQCGNNGRYPFLSNGISQMEIDFIDSKYTGMRAHAGNYESIISGSWSFPNNWLGIVVVKEF